MGQPAARATDMHTCPMCTGPVPHVGGPLLPGQASVLVAKLPAVRATDKLICVGPPDMVALGSFRVFIDKLPAARMGDITGHGGPIVAGCPVVLIG
jgi:uncharacterized Zn-binding protein involved in type VI secretion